VINAGRPELISTTLNLVNVASVTLVQLPGILYLTILSLPLTLIDLKTL